MKITFLKELSNFITNDYKESESIVEVLPLAYLIGVLSFLFAQKLIAWAFIFIVIGGLLNWFVIAANKGNMPVLAKNRIEFKKLLEKNPNRQACMITKKIKFSWLADRFYLLKSWLSIGDFTAVMGVALLIINLITNIK